MFFFVHKQEGLSEIKLKKKLASRVKAKVTVKVKVNTMRRLISPSNSSHQTQNSGVDEAPPQQITRAPEALNIDPSVNASVNVSINMNMNSSESDTELVSIARDIDKETETGVKSTLRKQNILHDIVLSDEIINYRNYRVTEFDMFWYLFDKYIKAGIALMEVNIDYRLREMITRLLDLNYTYFDNNGCKNQTFNHCLAIVNARKVKMEKGTK